MRPRSIPAVGRQQLELPEKKKMLIFLRKLTLLGVVMMKRTRRRIGRHGLMMRCRSGTRIVDGKAARARPNILVLFQIHKTRHGFFGCFFCFFY
jgi:hypothetical protein